MIRHLATHAWDSAKWPFQFLWNILCSLRRHETSVVLLAGAAGFYALVLWRDPLGNPSLLATMVFSTATAFFSYLAYRFSKERFRLDLFDRRFAVYEATLEFCSRVIQEGTLRAATPEQRGAVEEAIRAAEKSFRGTGWHKAQALFGEDIWDLFSKLNKSFAWLSTYGNGPGQMTQGEWGRLYMEHTGFIWDTVNRLPHLFKGYVYFGDYRRD